MLLLYLTIKLHTFHESHLKIHTYVLTHSYTVEVRSSIFLLHLPIDPVRIHVHIEADQLTLQLLQVDPDHARALGELGHGDEEDGAALHLHLPGRELLHVAGDEDVRERGEDVGVRLGVGVAAKRVGRGGGEVAPPQALLHGGNPVLTAGQIR